MTMQNVMRSARAMYTALSGPSMGIERRSPERLAADELSETDLEHVAGGLARAWAREESLDLSALPSTLP